jgi:hypothetical protein
MTNYSLGFECIVNLHSYNKINYSYNFLKFMICLLKTTNTNNKCSLYQFKTVIKLIPILTQFEIYINANLDFNLSN